MQIFNRFTSNGKTVAQSAHLDKENACIVIAESDGVDRKEIIIDVAGAEALCKAIEAEINGADKAQA